MLRRLLRQLLIFLRLLLRLPVTFQFGDTNMAYHIQARQTSVSDFVRAVYGTDASGAPVFGAIPADFKLEIDNPSVASLVSAADGSFTVTRAGDAGGVVTLTASSPAAGISTSDTVVIDAVIVAPVLTAFAFENAPVYA